MKNQTHTFKLIDSTYSAFDAREIISTLLTDKIRFLNVQILSIRERYGHDTFDLENRVKELEADRARMVEVLTAAIKDGSIVDILSEVHVSTRESVHIDSL